jgi:DNA-binding NarL/FixJ family response regulator
MITNMPPDVLVVDDDATFRALAMRLLARAGLTVAGEADSVRRAMEAAIELQPGAVLLDVGLPDGNGVTLARELVALPWKPRVLLTSSDADAATPAEVDRAGAAGFIAKDALTDAALLRVFAVG